MPTTRSYALKNIKLPNLSDKDLEKLEKRWEQEGKSPSKKRYLRYYYRHRERYLVRRVNTRRLYKDGSVEDYVERVKIQSGLIC